jgi:hypothetical protein
MTDKTITDHINKDKKILDDPTISSRRHLESELESLQRYHERHPNDTHDPTALELFCDEYPDASECRIYED